MRNSRGLSPLYPGLPKVHKFRETLARDWAGGKRRLVRNIKGQHKMRSKGMIRFILTFCCIHHNIFRDTINKYA